jgi:putative hemolysin
LSPTLLTIVAGLLLAAAFVASLAVHCLRNFSRSRLADICRIRENDARFGRILKEDIEALTAAEILFVLLLVCAVCIGAAQSSLTPGNLVPWTIGMLAAAIVSVGAFVILPWSISRVASETLLYHLWPLLVVLLTVMRPLVGLTNRFDTLVHRIAGRRDPGDEETSMIADEIQSVVNEGEREGLLETRAGRMIHRIMELSEEDVGAVMTPRTEMFCIHRDVSLSQARTALLDAGHSRVPVIGDSPDDIVGLLYAKDLLRHIAGNGHDVSLTSILREPFYIPETTAVDQLLERMKRERFHMAIVLDEYGGVLGLVTLEDILEEIVGEIEDEHDPAEEEPIHQIDEWIAEVDGRVHIDDLNERFNYDLPEKEDFDTIGGFVFSELGHVPEVGESLTWQTLRMTVLEADKRRVIKLRMEIDRSLIPAADDA